MSEQHHTTDQPKIASVLGITYDRPMSDREGWARSLQSETSALPSRPAP